MHPILASLMLAAAQPKDFEAAVARARFFEVVSYVLVAVGILGIIGYVIYSVLKNKKPNRTSRDSPPSVMPDCRGANP